MEWIPIKKYIYRRKRKYDLRLVLCFQDFPKFLGNPLLTHRKQKNQPDLGKKNHPIISRGTDFRAQRKKTIFHYSRSPPPTWAVHIPVFLYSISNSQMIKDYIKKIPTFIAFFKLLLGHVKVKIKLISWCFLDAPPPAHWFTPPFLGKGKVLRWYLSGPSLMCMWFVVPDFSNFKCFGRRKTHDFWLI